MKRLFVNQKGEIFEDNNNVMNHSQFHTIYLEDPDIQVLYDPSNKLIFRLFVDDEILTLPSVPIDIYVANDERVHHASKRSNDIPTMICEIKSTPVEKANMRVSYYPSKENERAYMEAKRNYKRATALVEFYTPPAPGMPTQPVPQPIEQQPSPCATRRDAPWCIRPHSLALDAPWCISSHTPAVISCPSGKYERSVSRYQPLSFNAISNAPIAPISHNLPFLPFPPGAHGLSPPLPC